MNHSLRPQPLDRPTALGLVPPEFNPTATTGELLRWVRQEHGVSFYRMAILANTDTSTIVRIVNGERHPTYPMLLAITRVLPITRFERDAIMASAGYLPAEVRLGWRPVLGEVATGIALLAAHPARLARYERQLLALSRQLMTWEG